MKPRTGIARAALALAAACAVARAECPPPTPVRLLSPQAIAGDKVGTSVATDAETICVGSAKALDLFTVAGAIDVYTRVPALTGPWTFQARLRPTPTPPDDVFGSSVSVRAATMAVGATGDNARRGAVYIFTRASGVWSQAQKLTAPDAAIGDQFGVSVALDGDRLAIGAYGDADAGVNTGSVYIFERPDSASPFAFSQKLLAPDPAAADEFGFDLAMSSGWLLAASASRNGSRGAVYAFERVGPADWQWRQTLTASDAAAGDVFGESIALEGDTAIIGAGKRDGPGADAGAIYVFRRSAGVWSQSGGAIGASDAAPGARFGYAVTLSADAALVGANRESQAGASAGAVYLLRRDNASAPFTHRAKVLLPGADANDQFGWSVALSGVVGAAGAPFNNDQGAQQGAAVSLDLPTPCPPDLTCDRLVNAADLAQLLGAWGSASGSPADLTGDGLVNAADLAQLLGAWGACP